MAKKKSRKPSVKQVCARYKDVYGGPIYDVLERMGLPNQVLSHDIRPLLPAMKVSGPAYTVKWDTRHPGQKRLAKVEMLKGLRRHSVGVCTAADGQSGLWGELTSNQAAFRGCQGCVVDGGVRDSSMHLEIPDWNAFCRYNTPIEAAPRAAVVAENEPILMSGSLTQFVEVRPRDFVFGDLDGDTIIPREIVLEVLVAAEGVVERERKGRALLWQGKSLEDIERQLGVG